MNIFKKMLTFIIISIFISHTTQYTAYTLQNSTNQIPIKAAVFLDSFDDLFISSIKKNLEAIQEKNKNKVQFTFFDAKWNQVLQNQNIDHALDKDFNLFVLRTVSTNLDEIKGIFNKIQQKHIPLILLHEETIPIVDLLKPYHNAVIISTDLEQSGILQGKILVDAWNANKEILDKNKDDIMQYIILKGVINSNVTIERSKYSIQTINEAGIKTQLLSSITCDWQEECAQTSIESNLLAFDDKIEAIISNNDAMAIGAVKALQKYGYNKGNGSKYIPVVGVDGLPEAEALIKQGAMTGTVVQDSNAQANAIYTIGMNLVNNRNSLDGTNYKFDKTGIAIKLPYYPYAK
jgi:methyl-galactoside transport system substrate-binding protein